MKTHKRHGMAFLTSVLAAAVLSGVAAAGNPHGAPPGQAKRHSSSGTTHASVSASVKVTARGRTKHQSTVAVSTSAGNAVGVKASSTTGFDTYAAAGSSATKSYGNGTTAGQIAEQHGAGTSAVLYGPGNSQPHKAALCSSSGKAHLVDVHALRVHGAGACVAATTSSIGSIRFGTQAAAGSSATKIYGNGMTAGQIAEQNGAGAGAVLYGPGNSQPHKVALCSPSGKVQLVDVHALLVHGAGSCVGVSLSSSGSTGSSSSGSVAGSVRGSVHAGGVVGVKAGARIESRAAAKRSHGVLGASHSLGASVTAQATPAQAVLGTASFTG